MNSKKKRKRSILQLPLKRQSRASIIKRRDKNINDSHYDVFTHIHDSQNGARAYRGKLDTYITLHTVIPYHHTTGTHRSRADDTALLCRMNKICLMKKCFTSWTDQTFRLLQSSCMARPYSLLFSYKQCCPTTSEQSSGRSCHSWGIAEQRRQL